MNEASVKGEKSLMVKNQWGDLHCFSVEGNRQGPIPSISRDFRVVSKKTYAKIAQLALYQRRYK